MLSEGANGNGTTPNDSILEAIFLQVSDSGAILNFPAGNFLFNETILVPDNIVIKGDGAEATTFTMDLGGSGHSFGINGAVNNSITTPFTDFAAKDDDFITVDDPSIFSIGDWIQIIQNDSSLITSAWANKTVGQIIQIKDVTTDKLFLESPLRLDYDLIRDPYVVKINPAKNVGIECLKILRLDDTSPSHTSNVSFSYAVNCWVNGIESENCTFSHVRANRSSNLHISKSYFHHGFDYGGGGRAYGVMLQVTSNECLVENNVFEHLRHSMIVQAGSNGNVFAYNYSFDPYWESVPTNSAGDLVLHGNYTYANLFEQNICQNIVIDNSHGPNGPYNTLLRNRAEQYGIFFSADNSPDQNFLGNEIPNTGIPYSLVNYTIQGAGHFIHGNNNKGNIHPSGTSNLVDSSYVYDGIPDFIPPGQWCGIGTPNAMGSGTISAYERYHSGAIFSNSCGDNSATIDELEEQDILVYPNPANSYFTVRSKHPIDLLEVCDLTGRNVIRVENVGLSHHINSTDWKSGIYLISVRHANATRTVKEFVKFE